MRMWPYFALTLGVLNGLTFATTVDESGSADLQTLQIINTDIGETIAVNLTRSYNWCYIQTPSGATVGFDDSNYSVLGLKLTVRDETCIATITVSEDTIGMWTLITRSSIDSEIVHEIRHPFQVIVEKQVEIFPQHAVTIKELSDLHIRLMEPTPYLYETCRLVPPNEDALSRVESDPNFKHSCAYVINSVKTTDSGTWEITYGNTILYRASLQLTVTERTPQVTQILHLVDQSAVDMEVGPENAVYCRMESSTGIVIFDGFGRCALQLQRVNSVHNGLWSMSVGLPGKVIAETYFLNIQVVKGELKPQVQMSVAMSKDDPSLSVLCSAETSSAPRVCKFRDPQGKILIAQQGVGEGRYTFQGTGVSINDTNKYFMDCGLRISSPTTEDLGIWRCAVETEMDTYYGFHLAVCPWLLMNGYLPPSVVTEPVLKPRSTTLATTAGDGAEMICTIPAGIRYCYFRSRNGTVFTVAPGESTVEFDYVGNGFDAGECGIRLRHTSTFDTGRWTCHVGIMNNGSLSEQRIGMRVYVKELILANLTRLTTGGLEVFALVNDGGVNLEYCRFVRNDGLGFTNEALPYGYVFSDELRFGRCKLHILQPTAVDFESWTVAARIQGQQYEVIDNTGVLRNVRPSSYSFFVFLVALICICIGLLCLSLSLLLSSKEKRRWTYARAVAVRDSVRRSLRFRKPPPVVPPTNENVTTSQAA